MRICMLVWSCSLLALFSVRADVLVLKNGKRLEGEVQEGTESYEVKIGSATLSVPKDQVEQVQITGSAAQDLATREAKLNESDVEGLLGLAHWARQRDLDDDYVRLLRKILKKSPDHPEALRLLDDHQRSQYEPPHSDPAEARLLKKFGPRFQILRTRHYRICHNTPLDYAQEHGRMLETLYTSFFRYFASRGFRLPIPCHPMGALIFNTGADFARYVGATSADGLQLKGFFSARRNQAAFFNPLNVPLYTRLRREIAEQEHTLRLLRADVRSGPVDQLQLSVDTEDGGRKTFRGKAALAQVVRLDAKLAADKRTVADAHQNEDVAVTIHEGTHQLVANSRLFGSTWRLPSWISEGLALFFESPRRGEWIGIGKVNELRLAHFREAREKDELLRLRQLIGSERTFWHPENRSIAYAETWALFYFLGQKHEQQLTALIKDVRSYPAAHVSANGNTRIQRLESVLGKKLDALEAEWLEYMATVTLDNQANRTREGERNE